MVRNQEGRSLTIGKLAQAGDVGVETVRFYQRRGLLDTPTRAHGVRRYGSEDLRRLRFIRQAQASGFTLEQIRELLELDAGADRARARTLADRNRVGSGTRVSVRVDLGGRRNIKNKQIQQQETLH